MFYLGTSHLAVFPSGSALVHFTGGCRTRQSFFIPGDASKTSSWKKHRNLEFFNMQHPFWVWKLRTCAPLVSSCWKVLTLILAVEIEEIETSIFKAQSHRFQNLGRTPLCWIQLKVYSSTFDSHPWLMDLKLVDVGYLVPLHGCVSRSPGPQKDEGRRCETCSGKREEKKGGWSRITLCLHGPYPNFGRSGLLSQAKLEG